jgi:dipeptidyl aminopeptidase/acylaminoacyl peptidase
MKTNGRSLRRVATSRFGDIGATWAPTGERLAYTTSNGTGLVDLATRDSVFLADRGTSYEPSPPEWSPDGERVLFSRNDPDSASGKVHKHQLWAMRDDGSRAHAVTRKIFPDPVEDPFDPTVTWVAATLHGTPLAPLSRGGGKR